MDSLLAVHKNDIWITADVLLVTFYELVADSTDNLVKKDPSKGLIILTGVKNNFLEFYKLYNKQLKTYKLLSHWKKYIFHLSC